MADPGWLAYLKEWPGLLLAGATIYALIKIIFKFLDHSFKMLEVLTEQRTVLAEAISLLRQLCHKVGKGEGQ